MTFVHFFLITQATNGEEVVGSVTLSNGNRIPSVARGCSIFDANVPDLLDPRSRPTGVVRLEVPQTAEGRLALLGGLPGVLAQMQRSHAQPNIKTFSLLLELTPSSRVVENDMLSVMTLHGVQPDVDFFAMLIRKRNLRKDYSGARVRDLVFGSRSIVLFVSLHFCFIFLVALRDSNNVATFIETVIYGELHRDSVSDCVFSFLFAPPDFMSSDQLVSFNSIYSAALNSCNFFRCIRYNNRRFTRHNLV